MLRSLRRDRPSARRPVVTAAAALAAGVSLAACGVTQGSQTYHEHEVEQAARLNVGAIQINDVYITPVGAAPQSEGSAALQLAPEDTPIVSPSPSVSFSSSAPAGSVEGYLVASVTNSSGTASDRVINASIGGGSTSSGSGGTVSLAPASAKTTVPPNGTLTFNDPAATDQGPFLVITGLAQPLQVGTFVPVTFTLSTAGQTATLQVPVVYSFAGEPPSSPPVPTGAPSASTSTQGARSHASATTSASTTTTAAQ